MSGLHLSIIESDRVSGSGARECAFLISPSDSAVAHRGLMFWETLVVALWPKEGKWPPACSLQWPALGQAWNCLSHEVGLGCTAGQSFNRVIMSKRAQPYSLPRRDQVQPCGSGLGRQEFSRAGSFVDVCVPYLCRVFHLLICTESQKGLFTRCWACSAGFSVSVFHTRLCYMMTRHRTWKPKVGQVLGRPPEPPLVSVTKASLFRVLCRYLVDVLFFLTSLRIRNEYVYDAFTI